MSKMEIFINNIIFVHSLIKFVFFPRTILQKLQLWEIKQIPAKIWHVAL